jgi:hypothetical protein
MTTITCWVSVAGTGTKTFYLGADSQGTSAATGEAISINVKKVYVSDMTPEIFAFAGGVGWGEHFLGNLRSAIHAGEFTQPVATIARATEFSKRSFAKPPERPSCELEVLYGARAEDGPASVFHLYQLRHEGGSSASWNICRLGMNELESETSTLVYSSGLGGRSHGNRQRWIARGDQGAVARTCFWSLCDLVDGVPRNDLMTGGFPQLAKLDQLGSGSAVGVNYHEVPTVYGRRVNSPSEAAEVWVDHSFTQLNPKTLEPYSKAQRYGRPENGR